MIPDSKAILLDMDERPCSLLQRVKPDERPASLLPLTERSVHLCVDMQRLFTADGPWPTPWMDRVLPVIAALTHRHPERTVFTRFIPPERPELMPGMWRRYYARWRVATREVLPLELLELMPPLARLCPPATIIDKTRYSAFAESWPCRHLRQREANTLIVSGSETDVCVLATVLDAVDIGYRVVVVRDAICSSSDEGHEMLMRLYHARFTEQIETADAPSRPRPMGVIDPSTSDRRHVERRPDVDQRAVFAVDWVLGWTREPVQSRQSLSPAPPPICIRHICLKPDKPQRPEDLRSPSGFDVPCPPEG